MKLYSYPEYFSYYRALRKLNLSFPDSSRLRIYGIDLERFYDTPLKTLSFLVPNTVPPDSIALSIEALIGIANHLDKLFADNKTNNYDGSSVDRGLVRFNHREFNSEETANSLVEDFFKHELYYKDYLGDTNFAIYKTIINELKDLNTYEGYSAQPQQHVYRERYMYNKFLALYMQFPTEKFFGQFGRCHVSAEKQNNPCRWDEFISVAARINNSNLQGLKGKMCSIAYFYKDDKSFEEAIKRNGKVEQCLEYAAKIDTVVAIEVTSDTAFFGDYSNYYDFLIFDNRLIEETSFDLSEDFDEDFEEIGNVNFDFQLGWQRLYNDYSNLNTILLNNNFNSLKSNIDEFVVGFQVNKLDGFCLGVSSYFAENQQLVNAGDTLMLDFFENSAMVDFGWNVLHSKHIFLKPQLGIGVTTNLINISQGLEKLNSEINFFGGRNIDSYIINYLKLKPSIEIIFKYSYIGIGFQGGYLFTPFLSKWSYANNLKIPESPKMGFDGFYFQLALHFMFDF